MAKKLFTLFGRAGNIKGKWRCVFPALLGVVWLSAVLTGCAVSTPPVLRASDNPNGLFGPTYENRIFFSGGDIRTVYTLGEDFEIKDSSGGYDIQDIEGGGARSWSVTVNGYNKHKTGEQVVTITTRDVIANNASYPPLNKNHETICEYRVTVVPVPVNRITLQQLPDRMTYTQGEDFNPTGLLVRVEYERGAVSEETIGPDPDCLILSGYNKNSTGVQTITVDYYGARTSFDVMVRSN